MDNLRLKYNRFGASCSVSVSERTDINNNTSTITITAKVKTSGSTYNTSGNAYVKGSYSGGASGTLGKKTFKISKSSSVSKSWTITVGHRADGTLPKISFSIKYYVTSSSDGTASASIYPATIPRKTGIGNVSATIGSAKSISIAPASGSFTHTLTYKFGSASGTILNKSGARTFSWTPPVHLYAQIPNSVSGTGVLTLTTYSGGTNIGSTSSTLTLSANAAACKPAISINAYDTNEQSISLTGSNKILIKGISNVYCAISKQTRNYAGINNVNINGVSIGSAASGYTFNKVNVNTFTANIRDSRGYTNSARNVLQMVQYIPLTINGNLKRTDAISGNVNLSFSGNYFNDTFGAVKNELIVDYRYKMDNSDTWSEWFTCSDINIGSNYFEKNDIVVSDIDPDYGYTFEIRAKDKINTNGYVVTYKVTKAVPIIWWNNDEVYLKNKSILDLTYPVGSIFMTIENISPASLFGGEWVRFSNGRVLVGVDENNTEWFATPEVQKGSWSHYHGTKGHVLNVNEIPAHSHSVTASYSYFFSMNGGGSMDWFGNSGATNKKWTNTYPNGRATGWSKAVANNTGGNGSHNHGNTETAGVVPPYTTVYMWKRVS